MDTGGKHTRILCAPRWSISTLKLQSSSWIQRLCFCERGVSCNDEHKENSYSPPWSKETISVCETIFFCLSAKTFWWITTCDLLSTRWQRHLATGWWTYRCIQPQREQIHSHFGSDTNTSSSIGLSLCVARSTSPNTRWCCSVFCLPCSF